MEAPDPVSGVLPYKVRATNPGEADVVDRQTGELVGRVERYGDASEPSVFRWLALYATGAEVRGMYGHTRADAARAVWDAVSSRPTKPIQDARGVGPRGANRRDRPTSSPVPQGDSPPVNDHEQHTRTTALHTTTP